MRYCNISSLVKKAVPPPTPMGTNIENFNSVINKLNPVAISFIKSLETSHENQPHTGPNKFQQISKD